MHFSQYIFIDLVNGSELESIPESNNFVETFDSLNVESRWSHDIYISQEPVCKIYKV